MVRRKPPMHPGIVRCRVRYDHLIHFLLVVLLSGSVSTLKKQDSANVIFTLLSNTSYTALRTVLYMRSTITAKASALKSLRSGRTKNLSLVVPGDFSSKEEIYRSVTHLVSCTRELKYSCHRVAMWNATTDESFSACVEWYEIFPVMVQCLALFVHPSSRSPRGGEVWFLHVYIAVFEIAGFYECHATEVL